MNTRHKLTNVAGKRRLKIAEKREKLKTWVHYLGLDQEIYFENVRQFQPGVEYVVRRIFDTEVLTTEQAKDKFNKLTYAPSRESSSLGMKNWQRIRDYCEQLKKVDELLARCGIELDKNSDTTLKKIFNTVFECRRHREYLLLTRRVHPTSEVILRVINRMFDSGSLLPKRDGLNGRFFNSPHQRLRGSNQI